MASLDGSNDGIPEGSLLAQSLLSDDGPVPGSIQLAVKVML